jgi:hypothetical protein
MYQKGRCSTHLRHLRNALDDYAQDNLYYPPADKWCDVLSEYTKNRPLRYTEYFDKVFKCPGAKEGRCNYAVNPNVNPNSPVDVVWVFDSIGGWNLHGGKELLNVNNHEGKGCTILFSDGKIEFIEKDKLAELKWK